MKFWPLIAALVTVAFGAGGVYKALEAQGERIDRIEVKVDRLLERTSK